MGHLSENIIPLEIRCIYSKEVQDLIRETKNFGDVCLVILPALSQPDEYRQPIENVGSIVAQIAKNLRKGATLVTLGEVIDLIQVQAYLPSNVQYHHWIAIKRLHPRNIDSSSLPNHHFGALIHTKYKGGLKHTTTRVNYSYCPACNKTTKDYGGKKHTYHEFGTSISDVWRDVACDLEGDLTSIIHRFRDLFGIKPYKLLLVLDFRSVGYQRVELNFINDNGISNFEANLVNSVEIKKEIQFVQASFLYDKNSRNVYKVELKENEPPIYLKNQIFHGDCLEWLTEIPDNSIDFSFTDPPYNLRKKYSGYADNLEIKNYFYWCDQWIAQLARVLKPGRTLALLNIPLWAVRHFLFTQTILKFQNWIVWDALAYPVRRIMPAHYTILVFSKGQPRELPGLTGSAGKTSTESAPTVFQSLKPLEEEYCLRQTCVKRRELEKVNDRGILTDLWWDVHRLKHNSRRVDHPTQLPPHLMYRLISTFSRENEVVLDCFNGAGTTTLAAHQLNRQYIGIENSLEYCNITRSRHQEIIKGIDPFRKEDRELTVKNSPVPRRPKQKYEVSKKTLQLEVRRIAELLGKLPSREEVVEHSKYPIKYYDEYFSSWGEVCAAARTTGMKEDRPIVEENN